MSWFASYCNAAQLMIAGDGMYPGLGELAASENLLISLYRRDWTGAELSALSLIPIGGQAAGAANMARLADRAADAKKLHSRAGVLSFGDAANDAGKAADKLSDAGNAARKAENKAADALDAAKPRELPELATGTKARKQLADDLPPANFPVDDAGHHILGVELFDSPVAKRLREWGIDLNSRANGVRLPKKDYPGRTAAIHSGRSSKAYNDEVLAEAGNKDEALAILNAIRQDLLEGSLKINNAPK